MSRTIEIFDVRDNIPNRFFSLQRPDFYKTGNWSRILDFIKNPKKDHPQIIIIQNIYELRKRNSILSEEIEDLVILYNHKNKENFTIIYDYFKKLKNNSISDLFADRPRQYGLRGDKELWRELFNYFKDYKLPETVEQFEQLIYDTIIILTGKSVIPIDEHKTFYVEKYSQSGISGGVVSKEFWVYKAIPILIGRYKRAKQ
ncbi:hypothetical protein [Kordia sp.]|uniref:hypothetical protein n=1 Tax=Kordia sp. TaxID=1965332 RepID=UPI003D2AEAD1